MKLNTNSNAYTILYAAGMVIIVAFLLAFVSDALKPTQDANVLRDTKNQILTSLNIEGLEGQAVDDKYAEVITDTLECNGNEFYVAKINDSIKYVLPVKGRGLWGGLWGYISVDEDKQHVYGTYFSHESETAGLGARINERWFQKQFNGRPIFDNEGNIALKVVKKGEAKGDSLLVDGVTGATLTSNGVANMVLEGLGLYKDFLAVMPCADEMDCCAQPVKDCCGQPVEGCCGEKPEGCCGKCQADEKCPNKENDCAGHCEDAKGKCPMEAKDDCCKNMSNK